MCVAERFATIERENRILLSKMSEIMQKNTLDNKNKSIQYSHSLNKGYRQRELRRITNENQVRHVCACACAHLLAHVPGYCCRQTPFQLFVVAHTTSPVVHLCVVRCCRCCCDRVRAAVRWRATFHGGWVAATNGSPPLSPLSVACVLPLTHQAILQRIQRREPVYNHYQWEEERLANERYLKNIMEYPGGAGDSTLARGSVMQGTTSMAVGLMGDGTLVDPFVQCPHAAQLRCGVAAAGATRAVVKPWLR